MSFLDMMFSELIPGATLQFYMSHVVNKEQQKLLGTQLNTVRADSETLKTLLKDLQAKVVRLREWLGESNTK